MGCALAFISADNGHNPQLNRLPLWPCPATEFCSSHLLLWQSRWISPHVRRHDKRWDLICIHEVLRMFKEVTKSEGSSQAVAHFCRESTFEWGHFPSLATCDIKTFNVARHQRWSWDHVFAVVFVCVSVLQSNVKWTNRQMKLSETGPWADIF